MTWVLDLLAGSPLLLLFVVIGVGHLLGTVRVFGFSLGPAAVLFTGIFLGAVDSRLRLPDLLYILGLILFVYTIGLQSGPTFFASFGRRALRANLFAGGAILLAAAGTYVIGNSFALNGAQMVGVFCGALTNTPALAASIEAVKSNLLHHGILAAEAAGAANAPVIGYSVSYPFGVIGVLLAFYLFQKNLKLRGGEDQAAEDEDARKPILARTFRVVNPEAVGKTVASLFSDQGNPDFVLSRLRRGRVNSLVYGETVLELGDLVVAVGGEDALERARGLFGEESSREIQTENQEFDFRRIEVSDRKVVGRSVGELDLQRMLDVTITRVRRGDVDFVPSGNTVLERGDRVRVLTWAGNIERVAKFFGDSIRSSSETDFLSLSIGLVGGVLLGVVPIPLPGGSTFTLGFAGGPLIAGLLLGRLQRTGAIVWGMPFGVNLTLRQVGLVLFLAGVGTRAGDGFVRVIAEGGWRLMLAGGVLTLLTTLVVVGLGIRLMRLSLPAAMGLMSGIQTQPACLAYATEHSSSNAPNIWYASVYPVSMIAKIVLAQLLVGLLVRF